MEWLKTLFGKKQSASSGVSPASSSDMRAIFALIDDYISENGGLASVVKHFEQIGFNAKVRSWVSSGPNLPINSVEALQLIGLPGLAEMAKKAGVDVDRLRDRLAEILPVAIDRATPGGKLP